MSPRRVRIILRDGRIIIDNFIARTANQWLVLEHHRIPVSDVRAFAPYR